jgi:hypothetical protein
LPLSDWPYLYFRFSKASGSLEPKAMYHYTGHFNKALCGPHLASEQKGHVIHSFPCGSAHRTAKSQDVWVLAKTRCKFGIEADLQTSACIYSSAVFLEFACFASAAMAFWHIHGAIRPRELAAGVWAHGHLLGCLEHFWCLAQRIALTFG